jgi:hypothetical protein
MDNEISIQLNKWRTRIKKQTPKIRINYAMNYETIKYSMVKNENPSVYYIMDFLLKDITGIIRKYLLPSINSIKINRDKCLKNLIDQVWWNEYINDLLNDPNC